MNQGRKETDRKLAELEKKISKEYTQAEKELKAKLDEHFRKFAVKDAEKTRQLKDGLITAQEYKQWRVGQMAVGQRWEDMRATVAQDLVNTTNIAKSMANGYMPQVYAINANYAAFEIEKGARVDTSFTLYDQQAVERLIKDDPTVLPPPGKRMAEKIRVGKARKWEEGQIQSVITQALIQGESISHIADRMAKTLCTKDRKAAIRYARTATTEAENAGRMDSYKRAEELGIKMKKTWIASLDGRTRDWHADLDGQTIPVDESFVNAYGEIEYPGDPGADPANVWNCRCTVIAALEGFERDLSDLSIRNADKLNGMSYEEWKKEKAPPETEPAKMPERVFEFTPASTIEEAEKYALQYIDTSRFGAVGVSYTGVSLDVANIVNETIGRFYETFDVEKFGGIIAPAGNTKLGKQMQNATAAYSEVRRAVFLNRQSMKTLDMANAAFAQEASAVKDILEHPEKYDMSRASPTLKRVLANSAVSGRGTIPETIEEAINHELGHSLERAAKRDDRWSEVVENMPSYNQGLSGYACESTSEYIAESFCSYMKGEGKVDPVLSDLFDSMRRE